MSKSEFQITNGRSPASERQGEDGVTSTAILESLIASSPQRRETGHAPPAAVHGAVIGTVTGWSEAGQPIVTAEEIPGQSGSARSVVAADQLRSGTQVVLLFEHGDPARPIVMATLADSKPIPEPRNDAANVQLPLPMGSDVQAAVDDDRIVLKADREIVLKCGKASLTLTRAGKVILRGAYVLSRSSGVNRIKGGSVQLN
jgi:hypothetical protein